MKPSIDRRRPIDGSYIAEFYRLWSAGAGYCNRKGVLRKLIAPVKQRIMRILLRVSRRHGWTHGVREECASSSHPSPTRILYIDTPRGQVSFHLLPWEYRTLPRYTLPWSGIRNSDVILIALFDLLQRQGAAGQEL